MNNLKLLIIIVSLLAVSHTAKAQDCTLTTNTNNNTEEICQGQTILFSYNCSFSPQSIVWDFDDGTTLESIISENTESIEHTFSKQGAFVVWAQFSDQTNTCTTTLPIKVGVDPIFANYKNPLENGQTGICLGDEITLSMPIHDTTIIYTPKTSCNNESPIALFNSTWQGKTIVRGFNNKTISDGDLEKVSISIEYDNIADLEISLTAPDGKKIELKSQGGTDGLKFGTPAKVGLGKLAKYTFTDNGQEINSLTLNQFTDSVITADTYKSTQSLSSLIGSPIDGIWTLTITSLSTQSDGYIGGYELIFSQSALSSAQWSYNQTYKHNFAVWNGSGIGATSSEGEAIAKPTEYELNRYNFAIEDNFNCPHDTFVLINVEKPTFKYGGDSTIFIGDNIEFENQTSWAEQCIWQFGDNTNQENALNISHVYYEKSTYNVIMTAYSQNQCTDADTMQVKVVPRPLEIKEINIFSPNNDGINDVFGFFDKSQSFLPNGMLTGMPANISSIKGKIYNKFGQTVCRWNNIYQAVEGWNGSVDNNTNRPCPPGTYFYDIIAYGKDGNSVKRSGSIFLYKQK